MTVAEATISSCAESCQEQDRRVETAAPAATWSVEESVFMGYLTRELKEWVVAGRPCKR